MRVWGRVCVCVCVEATPGLFSGCGCGCLGVWGWMNGGLRMDLQAIDYGAGGGGRISNHGF